VHQGPHIWSIKSLPVSRGSWGQIKIWTELSFPINSHPSPEKEAFQAQALLCYFNQLGKKLPVLGYQIQDQNIDGQSFAQFVKNRQRCRLVTHDILKRATILSAKTSKKNK
jgi:hypothetical protein